MIKKLVYIFILLIITVSVYAGVRQAVVGNKSVLYLYTKTCTYCKQFDPTYKKVANTYRDKCNFKKIDAHTKEGLQILYKYKIPYVPFVMLIDEDSNTISQVPPGCLLNISCFENVLNGFTKK